MRDSAPSSPGPLVTVIVPVYNAGAYLLPAVCSVLEQSYRHLEVLVVDDGCTDGCVSTLDGLDDPRLRVLRQENAGKAAAMNRALDAMRGEFYALQDADDRSYPERIARQLDCLRAHPEVAAVFCGHDLILGEKNMAPCWAGVDQDGCRREIDGYRMPGHDPTAMFRVAAVAELRYAEDLQIGQGFDYVLRVGEQHPMLVLGACLYSYRVDAQSATHRDPHRRNTSVREVRRRARRRRGLPDDGEDRRDLGENVPLLGRFGRDDNVAAHFMESVIDQRAAGHWFGALRTALQCARLRPLDPHHYKALVFALVPAGLRPLLRRRVWRSEHVEAWPAQQLAGPLALLVGIWLGVISLLPFEPPDNPRRPGSGGADEPVTWTALGTDLGVHSIAFVGLGLLLGFAGGSARRGLAAALLGCGALELLQAAIPGRHALPIDWLCNSAAVVLGAVVGRELAPAFGALVATRAAAIWRGLYVVGALGAAWVVAGLHRGFDLSSWDPSHAVVIGDEANGQRPWRGTIDETLLYPQALTPDEAAGLAAGTAGLRHRGIVVPPAGIPPGARTEALCRQLTATAEFSVELVGLRGTPGQTGPARVVTFSRDAHNRNFTLGQIDDQLELRVRCGANGPDGTRWVARWPDVFVDDAAQHLLVTYDRGVMRLFRAGQAVGPPASLAAARLAMHPLARGGTPPLALLLFLPLGFALRRGWPRAPWLRRAALGGVLALAPLGLAAPGAALVAWAAGFLLLGLAMGRAA